MSDGRDRAAATVLDGLDEVRAAVGTHLGYSDWLLITQDRVDLFADATGGRDENRDPMHGAAGSPGGPTIAPGYLTVSLSNMLLPQVVEVRGVAMGVNYGTGEIRFPAPVPVGSRVRAGAELAEVTDIDGGVQTLMRITIEVEGDGDGDGEPACVIESLSRWLE